MNDIATSWLLVFARITPVVVLHPVFGGRTAPRVSVATVAAALSTAFFSANHTHVHTDSTAGFVFTLAVEVSLGAAIGCIGVAVFGVIESAGRVADDFRGASLSQLFAPQVEAPTSPLGQFDVNASLAVFWAAGLHVPFLATLATTLVRLPPGSVSAESVLARMSTLDGVLDVATVLSQSGLAIAGSAAAACVCVDALFGIVNRSAQQANVFSLALPVKLLAAVFVTAVSLPGRFEIWTHVWADQVRWIEGWIAP